MTFAELCKMADNVLISDEELQDAADDALAEGEITTDEHENIERRIEASEET